MQQTASATSRYWNATTGHGDVVALTDTSGNVVDRYHYDAWGMPTIDLETVQQPLLYAGYWYDRELHLPTEATGWYWLSVRNYDPSLKRFLQPDPDGIEGMRSYVYVGNDLVDFTDPLGFGCGIFLWRSPPSAITVVYTGSRGTRRRRGPSELRKAPVWRGTGYWTNGPAVCCTWPPTGAPIAPRPAA